MYTISRPDFNNTLIELKRNNPNLDIQVLISNRRVGASENVDTHAAAKSLVNNLIPVYNSTTDDDKVDGFYHNKYQNKATITNFKITELWYQRYLKHYSAYAQNDKIYFLYAELLNQHKQYSSALKYYELAAYENDLIIHKASSILCWIFLCFSFDNSNKSLKNN